jgi:hypothetical protein
MSYFVVEHKYKGHPVIETIAGVEDIDMSNYPELQTLWMCENEIEVQAVESELRRKHGRPSK